MEEIVPDFVDPSTDGPLPGKEGKWSLVTEYRVRLAMDARHWEEAERLESVLVGWNRQRAAPILARPPQTWSDAEKNAVRSLAVSLEGPAHIQREQGLAACVDGYKEALALVEKIADTHLAEVYAFNLGHAYKDLAEIRDLAVAEQWYRRSLDLCAKEDRMGQAGTLCQLGSVAREQFLDARKAKRPSEECAGHLSQAEKHYRQALAMLPPNTVSELATVHNQLGNVYDDAGQVDTALRHYRESIRYKEAMQDSFAAGKTRYNVAATLFRARRFGDAREWAQSALRDYEACENAEEKVVMTLKLLELIESALQAPSPPS